MAGNLENARDLGAGIYTQAEVDAAITDEPKVSASASSVLLGGNLALANYAVTKNFATVTYTGNGGTQSINTGISSVDFTVSGNGSGYWLDRTTNQVKNDAGTVQASGSCVCNVSKVHIKSRNNAHPHMVFDGLRGDGQFVFTDGTNAEQYEAQHLTAWTATGFTLVRGASDATNSSGWTYVAYQTLYTHIKWGTTNQGKFYVEAYNPVTREGMVYYIGSGLAGHEIPHSQETELELVTVKNLSIVRDWSVVGNISGNIGNRLVLNGTGAVLDDGYALSANTSDGFTYEHGNSIANSANTFIAYYKAKSETWTIVQYQGTGASGNFVETVDVNGVAKKPRRAYYKCLTNAQDWELWDTERGTDKVLYPNGSWAEATDSNRFQINSTGFTLLGTTNGVNGSGQQYIALVEFDTNGNGGDSYFDLPTDDSNLNVTAGTFTYTNGIGSNGYERSAESYTGAIDFAGVADGIVYVYKEKGGSFGFDAVEPVFAGTSARATGGHYFNTKTGKWYNDSDVEQTPRSYVGKVIVSSETPMDLR